MIGQEFPRSDPRESGYKSHHGKIVASASGSMFNHNQTYGDSSGKFQTLGREGSSKHVRLDDSPNLAT